MTLVLLNGMKRTRTPIRDWHGSGMKGSCDMK